MLGSTVRCSPPQHLLVRNDQLHYMEWMPVYTYHPQTSFNYNLRIHTSVCYPDVRSPTIEMVTPGENSISLEWSPPSEGDPLSYTVTWTPSGRTSSSVLHPAARNYTIRGLDSNTAYSGTVEVYALTNNATVSWEVYTLPQGELVSMSNVLRCNY